MAEIEIKRGYEVLPDNNVRFGIRVINNSDSAISDVEVILDFTESLFQIEGSKIQKLGNIPPGVPRTAKFIMKPLGCIHKENISATIIFKDHQWKKHTLEMRPKEVHCVCPFLKEKSIKRSDFLTMSQSGFMEERGLNFDGITVDKLVDFLAHTCKNRLYKVDEFTIENGKILYLAGDAVGEKAYYLLTAVVKEYEGLTQVLLRVNSDKIHGLNGFLNETLDNLRHLVLSSSAREIGIIKKEQVINIIDSVVQRSNISIEGGAREIKIKESMVQRVDINGDEGKKRREEKSQGKEEEEGKIQEIETSARKAPERSPWKVFSAIVLVLSVLALGYWALAPGATDSISSARDIPSKLDEYDNKSVKVSVGSLSGWDYRKQKTITGTTAGAQTNYQMTLTIYKASGTDTPGVVYLGGNVKDDFSDLRFTRSDGVTLLDYWIESFTSGVSAVVWVELDSIPASPGTTSIYLYYGNPTAAGAGSGARTFSLFDDFDDGTYSGWTVVSGTWSAAQGFLRSGTAGYPTTQEIKIPSSTAYGGWEWDFRTNGMSNSEMFFKIMSDGKGIGNNQYAHRVNPVEAKYFDIRRDVGGLSYPVDSSWTRDTNWHKIKITRNQNGTFELFLDGTSKGTGTDNTITSTSMLAIFTEGLQNYDFDNIRIQKYVSPEPAWSA